MSSWDLTGRQKNYGKQVGNFHGEEEKEKNQQIRFCGAKLNEQSPIRLNITHLPHPVTQLLKSLSAPTQQEPERVGFVPTVPPAPSVFSWGVKLRKSSI